MSGEHIWYIGCCVNIKMWVLVQVQSCSSALQSYRLLGQVIYKYWCQLKPESNISIVLVNTYSSFVYIFLVTITVNNRKVCVKGPRGILRRHFKHMSVDIKMVSTREILVEKWFGIHKELAAVNTVCSHIKNMIKGVTLVSQTRLGCVF